MTEDKKNGCIGSEDHIHNCNCEGEDCSCEDNCSSESDIITLDMEDGTQKDFQVLDILEHDGKQYVALSELDSLEYDILGMIEVDGSYELTVIEDDAEYDAIAAKFDEHFASMEISEDSEDNQ